MPVKISATGGRGGEAGPSQASGSTIATDSKTNGITIAPIGVNFGELINALIPGAPSNGGVTGTPEFLSGEANRQSNLFSRLSSPNLSLEGTNQTSTSSMIQKVLLFGGMGLVSIFAIKKLT